MRCANGVCLSAVWQNTTLVQWIRCEPLGEHIIYWTCAATSHITRKMSTVCISSHDHVTHATHCSSNYSWGALWDDTDIRLITYITSSFKYLNLCSLWGQTAYFNIFPPFTFKFIFNIQWGISSLECYTKKVNFHALEAASSYCVSQLQVGENYSRSKLHL